MDSRPRAYDAIPALHKLSLFLEDATTLALGDFRVEATGGVRAASMFNLGRRYTIQGKFYFDPRANVVVALPRFHVAGRNLTLRLGGGVGWHTKFPTMDSLYPDTEYFDFTQLNYWPANPALRRINLRLYTLDPTNYDLRAARNFKWEVRLDAGWNDNQLSVTYFREDMTSGFRTTSDYRSFTFRDYDETAIDMEQLDGPPSLDGIPYTEERRLGGYSRSTNGSRTEKSGIEFAFTSQRIRATLRELPSQAPISGRTTPTCTPSTCCRPPPPEDRAILTSGTTFRRTVTCAKCAIPIFCSTRRFPA